MACYTIAFVEQPIVALQAELSHATVEMFAKLHRFVRPRVLLPLSVFIVGCLFEDRYVKPFGKIDDCWQAWRSSTVTLLALLMASPDRAQCFALQIGLALGFGLGILLLAALATMLYYRHKYLQTKHFLQQHQQRDSGRADDMNGRTAPHNSPSKDSEDYAAKYPSTSTSSDRALTPQPQKPAKTLVQRSSRNWPFSPVSIQPRLPSMATKSSQHDLQHKTQLPQRSPILPVPEIAGRCSQSSAHRNWSRPDRGSTREGGSFVGNASPVISTGSVFVEPLELGDGRRSVMALTTQGGDPAMKAKSRTLEAENLFRNSYTTW